MAFKFLMQYCNFLSWRIKRERKKQNKTKQGIYHKIMKLGINSPSLCPYIAGKIKYWICKSVVNLKISLL